MESRPDPQILLKCKVVQIQEQISGDILFPECLHVSRKFEAIQKLQYLHEWFNE